jgi:hypothetical protein
VTVYTGTPTTLVAGDTSQLVTKFNDHRDALLAVSEPLTAYVPTYTGITIGNATVLAAYQQTGKWVRGHVKITFGGTSSFSATTLLVTLPVAADANWAANCPVGSAFLLDGSVGSATRTIATPITSSSTAVFFVTNATGGTVTNLVPWTWASTDILAFNFEYEAS